MRMKQVVGAIVNMLFRLGVSCLVVVAVYRAAMYSYHFGYMVFNDAAKEISPGRDITISIEMDDSVMKIGETLASRGLVEDAKIFYVQERLSEYHGDIQPGVYTLNTSMKPSELIAVMAAKDESLNGEDSDDNQSPQNDVTSQAGVSTDGEIPDGESIEGVENKGEEELTDQSNGETE